MADCVGSSSVIVSGWVAGHLSEATLAVSYEVPFDLPVTENHSEEGAGGWEEEIHQ